ncbi:MAG: helix-turn-helix domain containing protein [Candidatus Moranbacteria bacterium]|nr:helix-turn-helix domain containing protein [Candidatus Moranbacteria bacterium]
MKLDLKNEAVKLRRKGFSFKEISEKLGISKSTASLWLRDVKLSKNAKERIIKLGVDGRNNSKKSVENRIAKEDKMISEGAAKTISNCVLLRNDLKLICALLYWCEGGKTEKAQLTFINSDPKLIKYFIDTFRKAFAVDEKRFRVLLHVHEYHIIEKQIKFWSKITKISESQFTKPYNKPNTGKRIKEDYQGCISVRYYGREIRQEMMFLIKEISK